MTSKAELISNIKKNMAELQKSFNATTAASWDAKVSGMQTYERLPKKGCFYDAENREKFNARCAELKAATLDQVQNFRNSIDCDVAAAPSNEAVRALQMFAMLPPETLASTEDYARRVNALADKYGDNVMFSESLRGIAAKNGVHMEEHPAIKAFNEADSIGHIVNNFFDRHHVLSGSDGSSQEITDAEIAYMFSDFASTVSGITFYG